ncbi:MAG: hypothetical protein HY876_02645 [Coriobacteriales bacterium]|nr:hypothetical protein [Coriobacteriales bacterium]
MAARRRDGIIATVQVVHAIVFVAIACCLAYVLLSGITGEHSPATWLATGVVTGEGAVLAVNRGRCPLSALSERLGDRSGPVTRIFFPEWFVPWVTPLFVALAIVGVALVVL